MASRWDSSAIPPLYFGDDTADILHEEGKAFIFCVYEAKHVTTSLTALLLMGARSAVYSAWSLDAGVSVLLSPAAYTSLDAAQRPVGLWGQWTANSSVAPSSCHKYSL